MYKNPVVAIPVVVKRLRQKDRTVLLITVLKVKQQLLHVETRQKTSTAVSMK